MNDLRKAAERALEAFEKIHEGCGCVKEDNLSKESNDLATLVRKDCIPQIKSLRQALTPEVTPEVPCKTHPDAPHGFDRNASHSADRNVCECESWEPVDNAYTKLDTFDRVLHKKNVPQP